MGICGLLSASGYTTSLSVSWGGTGYSPVAADYDGDGRTDPAVYQASSGTWLVLLSGAGFFIRGLQRFMQRDAGWRTDGLLTAYVTLKGQTYATPASREAFFRVIRLFMCGL